MGKAGDGFEWHHIVEQTRAMKSGIAPEKVHNLRNIVKIPGGYKGSIHSRITGIYNSKIDLGYGKITVRDWISAKSFEEQFEFGLNQLRMFGDIKLTTSGWIFTPFE